MTTASIIAVLSGISVLAIFFVISVIIDYNKNKDMPAYQQGAWLFSNAEDVLYNLFYGDKDQLEVAKKLRIPIDEYFANCRTVGIKPRLKKYICNQIIAVLIIVAGVIISAMLYLMGLDLLYVGLLCMFCLIIGMMISTNEKSSIEKAAKAIKEEILDEMPRFLDLLETALYIGMPIETAIKITAESIPGVLSEELLASYSDTRNSELSWIRILEDIAKKYNVECLNSLVQDISTSSSKGVSVLESITRQNNHTKQTKMMSIEERAEKAKSQILIPVAIFKNGADFCSLITACYEYNVRVLIREILKSLPETARLGIVVKVPQCTRRSTCTFSTLISLNAVLVA